MYARVRMFASNRIRMRPTSSQQRLGRPWLTQTKQCVFSGRFFSSPIFIFVGRAVAIYIKWMRQARI